MLCHHWSAVAKTLVCYQYASSYRYKAQHQEACYGEKELPMEFMAIPHTSYFISVVPIFSNSCDFTAIHSESQTAHCQNQVTLIFLTHGADQWQNKADKSFWDFNPNGDSSYSHLYTILKVASLS